MKPRRLIAGPFLGEFGWELFCWQAKLRLLSKNYEETFVLCRKGHEILYKDFARVNDMDMPYVNCDCGHDNTYAVVPANKGECGYNKKWTSQQCRAKGFFRQDFIQLGKKTRGVPTVLIHARSRTHRGGDNWGLAKYIKLVDMLHAADIKVGAIGLRQLTEDLDVDTDYRDKPLDRVCNLLATTKCLVGTSSGPLHLAALCKTPHVVFTGRGNLARYNCHWNPFRTPFRLPPGDWHPTPLAVFKHTMDILEGGAYNGEGVIK